MRHQVSSVASAAERLLVTASPAWRSAVDGAVSGGGDVRLLVEARAQHVANEAGNEAEDAPTTHCEAEEKQPPPLLQSGRQRCTNELHNASDT